MIRKRRKLEGKSYGKGKTDVCVDLSGTKPQYTWTDP